ncbi:hypothetical protein KEM56_007219 [Ascosphaera pollenicola]|nr:hypothetical protein KEM56_007219 [Ascosphaera pollenicola]
MAGILQILAAYGGIFLAIYAATYSKQTPLETPNFNVTQALVDVGVEATKIPVHLHGIEQQQQPLETTCKAACDTLSSWFGSKVSPEGSKGYDGFLNSFWARQQRDVHPQCVFAPTENAEISATVLLSRLSGCPFSVRGGGHSPSKGFSNSPGGISIWMKEFNDVNLSEDKKIVSVGAGLTWGEVYDSLQGTNLTVVGARAATVGVGGFLLGGGISFHSNLYGLGIDNVESLEVVTASGKIVTARRGQHEDLYQALKGCGNNFGIVTKFNLYTIPDQPVHGGIKVYAQDHKAEVINAFVQLTHYASIDGNAQQWLFLMGPSANNAIGAELTYLVDEENPEVLKRYNAIPMQRDTTSRRSIAQYSREIDLYADPQKRTVFWTISVDLSEDFMNWVADYWYSTIANLPEAGRASPVLAFHPFTTKSLGLMNKNMGNALGLEASTKPLLIIHLLCTWENAENDNAIDEWLDSFSTALRSEAKRWRLQRSFLYMNYANHDQDVISSYGASNGARLRRVASHYDPSGVFQKLQRGGFKLGVNA